MRIAALRQRGDHRVLVGARREPQQQVQAGGDALDAAVRAAAVRARRRARRGARGTRGGCGAGGGRARRWRSGARRRARRSPGRRSRPPSARARSPAASSGGATHPAEPQRRRERLRRRAEIDDPVRREPLQRADRRAVVAVLGVVVVLDHDARPTRAARAAAPARAPRRSGTGARA